MFAQVPDVEAVELVCRGENLLKLWAQKVVQGQYLSYDEALSDVCRGVFAGPMDLRVV